MVLACSGGISCQIFPWIILLKKTFESSNTS
jgi:hypothetical protein